MSSAFSLSRALMKSKSLCRMWTSGSDWVVAQLYACAPVVRRRSSRHGRPWNSTRTRLGSQSSTACERIDGARDSMRCPLRWARRRLFFVRVKLDRVFESVESRVRRSPCRAVAVEGQLRCLTSSHGVRPLERDAVSVFSPRTASSMGPSEKPSMLMDPVIESRQFSSSDDGQQGSWTRCS